MRINLETDTVNASEHLQRIQVANAGFSRYKKFRKKFCTKNAFNPTQRVEAPGFTRVSAGRIEIVNPTLILPNPTPNPTRQTPSIYWGFRQLGWIKANFLQKLVYVLYTNALNTSRQSHPRCRLPVFHCVLMMILR